MRAPHYAALLIIALLALPSSAALAFDDDEMTFEPDEVADDPDDDFDDDDEMTFAPDDLDDTAYDPEADMAEALDVGVVTVPTDDLSDADRDRIQSALREAAREIPEISTYGDSDLLPALVDRDADYCSRESLCLAGVGRSAGVDRILQARVEQQDDGYRLDLDYFDVDERLFVAYHSNTRNSDIDEVIEGIPAGVNDIFGIRGDRLDDGFVDQRDVNVGRIASYFGAGAAVVALGAGSYYGLQVRSDQDDLDGQARDDDGRYTELSQREARSIRRDMDSNARNANLFLGIGAGLAVTSVVLFFLSSEDDPAMAANATLDEGLRIAPQWDSDRFGLGATWTF